MDSLTLAWTLVVFFAGALLTFVGLCMTGQLVPGSKLERAQDAADHFEDAWTTLKIPVERFGMLSDMTKAVLLAAETKASTTQVVTARGGE